ncbi:MAG: hypothetical protein GY807_24015 [Gammaproteobacteria bacterium]|nr:hypothetical protein [Gammaproteobacteria bacterium]
MSETPQGYLPTMWQRFRWRLGYLWHLREKAAGVIVRLGMRVYPDSNGTRYARKELELAGWYKSDGFYGSMMGHAVESMVKQFSMEGHSGMSVGLAVSLFKRVSGFHPLTPLTGEDDEWADLEYNSDMCAQNKRASSVFRRADGTAYRSDAIVFRDETGCTYQSRDSRQDISFPYEWCDPEIRDVVQSDED